MVANPLRRWLNVRIRILCVVTFVVGGLLPPYVPKEALAGGTDENISVDEPQFLLVEDGFLMKSSSLTQQGSRRAYAEGIIVQVGAGDSLEKMADRYGVTVDTIVWANALDRSAALRPGQELVILPVNGVLHTVTRGQTLQEIAELYNVPSSTIATQNKIQSNFILAGQELIIPDGKPIIAGKPGQSALSFNPNVKSLNPPKKPKPASQPSGIAGGKPTEPTDETADTSYGLLGMPCNECYFTQYYHPGHYAVDIQTRGGGPIFSAEDGIVTRADYGWDGGYGNVLEIDHGNGLVTLYGHNKELYVKLGDHVKRGDQIAWMGNTGQVYGVTGIHTHFEVRVNGIKKNPLLYLK